MRSIYPLELYCLFTPSALLKTPYRKLIFYDKFQRDNQEFFYAGEVSWNKCLLKTFHLQHMKERSPRRKFGVFSPQYSQNSILNEKFSQRINTIWTFFSRTRKFFSVFKLQQRRPTPSPR